jgi:hypothetical protein
MVRTQVQLTEDQHRRLKRWANRLGVSLSEAVRRCVANGLAKEGLDADGGSLIRDAMAVIGRYAESRPSRVAESHDRHLAKAWRK